jgi:hypothetical protein
MCVSPHPYISASTPLHQFVHTLTSVRVVRIHLVFNSPPATPLTLHHKNKTTIGETTPFATNINYLINNLSRNMCAMKSHLSRNLSPQSACQSNAHAAHSSIDSETLHQVTNQSQSTELVVQNSYNPVTYSVCALNTPKLTSITS